MDDNTFLETKVHPKNVPNYWFTCAKDSDFDPKLNLQSIEKSKLWPIFEQKLVILNQKSMKLAIAVQN